eukprot:9325427-Pyramimonas_sp.AAC.1
MASDIRQLRTSAGSVQSSRVIQPVATGSLDCLYQQHSWESIPSLPDMSGSQDRFAAPLRSGMSQPWALLSCAPQPVVYGSRQS